MSRYMLIEEDVDEPCVECDDDGDEIVLCTACAGVEDDECPRCHADSATIKIDDPNDLWVYEGCADREEGA